MFKFNIRQCLTISLIMFAMFHLGKYDAYSRYTHHFNSAAKAYESQIASLKSQLRPYSTTDSLNSIYKKGV